MKTVGDALLEFLDGYYLRIDGRSFVGVRQDDWDRLTSGRKYDPQRLVTFAGWKVCLEPDQKRRFVAWEE